MAAAADFTDRSLNLYDFRVGLERVAEADGDGRPQQFLENRLVSA